MNLALLWHSCLPTDTMRLRHAHPAEWAVHPSWQALVTAFWQSQTGRQLVTFLSERLSQGARIFPPEPLRALALTPLTDVKVVILGQDPYHGAGQAEGLSFSVPPGVTPPPSLRNIFKELCANIGGQPPMSGSLVPWAQSGVLLLNTCLTVEDGQPTSHAQQGWERLTDSLIGAVARQPQPIVFMLWGAHAQSKRQEIERQGVRPKLMLQANHPSPLSALRGPAPFIGCQHFTKSQQWLNAQGVHFDWKLEK